ncbi:MAG: M48 family metallopeptidase [Candidatus Omnitrophica bacterium]|nr:M48 family metallopeptidase [Candidatus Omnitrophota bacterium]
MRKILNSILAIAFILNITGCATVTGPKVTREEIQKAQEELMVKALDYRIKQNHRLWTIGDRLITAIPKEDIKTPPKPLLGVMCLPIDKYLAKLYNLDTKKGVVIVGVKEKSPAGSAGLKPGDLLVSLKNKKVPTMAHLSGVLNKLKIGEKVAIEIKRGQEMLTLESQIAETPLNIPISMVEDQQVNAATDGKMIVVTQGLMNFAKSDDEIAAVICHELAHSVRGHIAKAQGGQILGLIAALALGTVAEAHAPGSGNAVAKGVGGIGDIFNATYSRDLEREADYFGTKFFYYAGYDPDIFATVEERFAIEIPATMVQNYLSTHPSSPERVVRIRKIIEELKTASPESAINGQDLPIKSET